MRSPWPLPIGRHPEVCTAWSVPRFRWRDFCQALRGGDALVSGGGSLFQDVTSRRSVYYYLGTLVLAGLCRRPVMICGRDRAAAGPAGRRLTAALLNHARLITVRDPASVEALTTLGVVRPRFTSPPTRCWQ